MTKLPAGLVDAGASSLATFVAGVAAVRLLDSSELGVYALFFSAWVLASQLPAQLILIPAEAKLVHIPSQERRTFLLRNSTMALPVALLGSAAVLGVLLVVPQGVNPVIALQLGATAALVAGLNPLQQHARRLLHLSRSHWVAASAALVRLGVVSVVVAAGWNAGVSPGLLPFGSLAAGDLCALAFSLLIVQARRGQKLGYTARGLMRSGRWLLLSASMGPAAGFAVSLLVTNLADADTLGLAEAARIAAQPVTVLALGLAAVLRPSSMEAAIGGHRPEARRLSRRFGLGLALATLLYLGAVSLPESINPLQALVPNAFTSPGLVELSVVAAFFNGVVFLQRSELIALGRTRQLAGASALASSARTAPAFASGALRAWTVALGILLGGLVRWVSLSRVLAGSYEDRAEEPAGAVTGSDDGGFKPHPDDPRHPDWSEET